MTMVDEKGAAPASAALNAAFVDPDAPPVPVPFGDCPCPGTPHPEGDTVFLRAELDVQGGFTFQSAFGDFWSDTSGMPGAQALGMAYLVAGITDWTFVDAKGQKIPASRTNIGRLRWTPSLADVADAAARRYAAAALLPLVHRMRRLSKTGPTADSTSRKKPSSTKRRTRS